MDSDDDSDWPARAVADPALAAAVLLRLRRDPFVSSAAAREVPPASWGVRRRRSSAGAPRGAMMMMMIGGDDAKEEEAAAEKRERLRASPMTPLDYGGGSDSGGEEMSKVASVGSSGGGSDSAADCVGGGRETKEMVAGQRAPFVFRIPDSKPIRRSTKKKTIPELLAMQRSLLDRREILQKEVEARRGVQAAVAAKNRRLKRLKLSLDSRKVTTTAIFHEDQFRDTSFQLPDLNIPLFEESN